MYYSITLLRYDTNCFLSIYKYVHENKYLPSTVCLQVVVTFEAKQDRNDFYTACKEGLKRTSLVVTMDSKSRLAGR